MKPILVIPGTDYVVCFDAEPEDMGMRDHFIGECGWTEKQFDEIEDFAWFQVTVSLWREGKLLGEEFLGCCCYKTEDEFWTTYAADYFSDMVCELLERDSHALQWATLWREVLRSPTVKETT